MNINIKGIQSLNLFRIQAYRKGRGLVYAFSVAADSELEAKHIAATFIGESWPMYDIRVKKHKDTPIYAKE